MCIRNVFLFVLLFHFVYSAIAQEPRLVLPNGHTRFFSSVVFSPDGKRILTASDDKTAKLWDVATGKLLLNFEGHTAGLTSAVFNPDATKVVTASRDRTAIIWDATSGKVLHKLEASIVLSGIFIAEFSADGNKILTASWGDEIKIWDANSGKLIHELDRHTDRLTSAKFSTDGTQIVTSSWDSTAVIWDANSGKMLQQLKGHTSWVVYAEFSTDGKKVVTASHDNTAIIWNATNGKRLKQLKGHTSQIEYAEFSPDRTKIVTVSYDKTAIIWDLASGKQFHQLIGTGDLESAKFSPDGTMIVTASSYLDDKSVIVWDVSTGKIIHQLKGHTKIITSIAYSSDGKKIVTGSSDNTAIIWDALSGELLQELKGHTSWINSTKFSPDGTKIVAAQNDNTSLLWDAVNVKLLHKLIGLTNWVIFSEFSPDGTKILTTSTGYTAILWEARTGKMIHQLEVQTGSLEFSKFNFDGKLIATTNTGDYTAVVWDAATGKMLHQLKGHPEKIHSVEFSPDGTKVVTSSRDSTAIIWDALSGELLHQLKGHTDWIEYAEFSPDNTMVVTASSDNSAIIWDAASGKMLHKLKGHESSIEFAKFSPDGKMIVTVSLDNKAILWDAANGKLLHKLTKQTKNSIYGSAFVKFSPDGTKVVISFNDATTIIWNAINGKIISDFSLGLKMFLKDLNWKNQTALANNNSLISLIDLNTGETIYNFFAVDSTDYFVQIPSGYYKASTGATKLLHYVTKDLKVITFEQLDVKYNRPDKVLEAIGNTDTALIYSYRKAWEKRIKKLSIDTTQFRDGYSVPEADFINRDSIDYKQKNGSLRLHIIGMDSTYKLDRFNIWVNEAPLFGQRGISIKHKNSNSLDTIISIQLSQGENRIETSITNVNGTESYRMPLYVNYTPAVQQKETAYFIGIGIDKFADNKFNLQYSSKDIRDLAIKLKEKYKENIFIDTLFNENVTTTNVKKLKEKLLTTSVNDKVIVSYSGHGLLSKDYDYYLSTYSVNFNKPEENGLPYDELENLLDSIPARKKLMLIDACHSGEVDKEEMQRYAQSENKLDTGVKGARKLELNNNAKLGMKNSFELMQNLFVNVGKSTGATIISAAAGTQFALERSDLKNGVFTYCILEEMKKNIPTTISQLKKTVGEQVEKMTNGLQKPTSRNENVAVDWHVW